MGILLSKLLPIVFLLGIGFVTKQIKLFSEKFVDDLKTLIIKVVLPAVLFDAFATMTLQASSLIVVVLIFVYCCVLYGLGYLLPKVLPKLFDRKDTKGFMTGFEFGMIGIGLFGAIWGMDKLPVIVMIALGHEIFIWFFYAPSLSVQDGKGTGLLTTLGRFIKTPTIVGIILGLIVNFLGAYPLLETTVIGGSLLATIGFLKPLTSPLILIVIGYTMVFQGGHVKEISIYIITRLLLTLGLGVAVYYLICLSIPGVNAQFTQAFFAFILLPAPYILPLYIENEEEAGFFTILLVYSTMVSFLGYAILVGLNF